MKPYLVRLIADANSKGVENGELVGIFAARSIDDLRELVSECCSAEDCEYTAMPSGGIYVPCRTGSVPVTSGDNCEPDWEVPLTDYLVTDDWFPFFHASIPDRPYASPWARLVPAGMLWLEGVGLRSNAA
jgi:hypothetical protein